MYKRVVAVESVLEGGLVTQQLWGCLYYPAEAMEVVSVDHCVIALCSFDQWLHGSHLGTANVLLAVD